MDTALNVEALTQFYLREKHTRVPVAHVETLRGREVPLGKFMAYVRQRSRAGVLDPKLGADVEQILGKNWNRSKTGPQVVNESRDENIRALRRSGMALQKIADQYGTSRQRIHQIVKGD